MSELNSIAIIADMGDVDAQVADCIDKMTVAMRQTIIASLNAELPPGYAENKRIWEELGLKATVTPNPSTTKLPSQQQLHEAATFLFYNCD